MILAIILASIIIGVSYFGASAYRSRRFQFEIVEFCHKHREKLVIICDPNTDRIMVAYDDRWAYGRAKDSKGKKVRVFRDLLKHTTLYQPKVLDKAFTVISETLGTKIYETQEFYRFLIAGFKAVAHRKEYESKVINKNKGR